MREDLIKHLEFIQVAINRMASNSFLLKGWTVTLSAALFALAAKDSNQIFAVLALFPALVFWGLDAYYLRQERLFRILYDELRTLSDAAVQTVEPFGMNTQRYSGSVQGWFRTLWSRTVFALHGIVVASILVVIFIIRHYRR